MAQVHLDTSPYFWLDSKEKATSDYTPSLRELFDWYERPSFANLNLDLNNKNFRLFMQIDLRSDLKADLDNFSFTNLPVPLNRNIYIDPNFPQVGYGEYKSEFFDFSIGRRKVDWSPGYYGLGFSDQAPYLDNISFDLKSVEEKGQWIYSFIVATIDNRASSTLAETSSIDAYKTFAAHNIAWIQAKFIFSITDYNLIYGRIPDLQDLAPFIHYHGLYQKGQNVALGITADSLISNNFRLYGEFFIDDFKISIESTDSNPGAMGAIVGLQYRFLSAIPTISPLESAAKHTLKNKDFSMLGGLVFRWENIWTSEYLYNRENITGQITNPLYYMMEYKPQIINTYFGAAYGPDRLIERLSLTWDGNPFKTGVVLEYHLVGNHGINGDYIPPFDNWLTLGNPVYSQVRISLNGEWEYTRNRTLFADLKLDFGNSFRIQGGLGWGAKLF